MSKIREQTGRSAERTVREEFLLSPPNPGEDFLTGVEWVTMANRARLTTREVVVATLILRGQTRKGIAYRLKLSPETVRVHIDHLFEKLRVRDRLGFALRIARIREAMHGASWGNGRNGRAAHKTKG